MARKKKEDEIEETAVEAGEATVQEIAVEAAKAEETEAAAVEAAPEAVEEKPKKATRSRKADKPESETAASELSDKKVHKRAERVGIVASDKMTKTVVVRVDRLVKHPTYRKYVKRRKRFMAHDEMGAKTGDRVRIVETRPLSARKRWRVVEILQKAEL